MFVKRSSESEPRDEEADEGVNLEEEGKADSTQKVAKENPEEVEHGEWEELPAFRVAKKVMRPSAIEVRRHNLTHLPFRSWCRWCVLARKPNPGHWTVDREEDSGVAEVHVDYCFFRTRRGGKAVVVLVAKDRMSRAVAGHVVPLKGASVDWVVAQLRRVCLRWVFQIRPNS